MSSTVEVPDIPTHLNLPHDSDENSGITNKIMNKSKVYPSEESGQQENFNHTAVESSLSKEEGKDIEDPEERRASVLDFFRRHFKETAILFVIVSVLATSLTVISIYYVLSRKQPELVYVNMIWRHGDRAPVYFFPNFTEKYLVAFPRGMGNLTKVYIRSTDVRRTIETAQNVLKGMQLSNTPIHAETMTDVDTEGNPFFYCPRAKQFVVDHEEKFFLRENFSEVYDLIEQKLNFNNYTYLVYDTVECLKAHDLELPAWMKDEAFVQKIKFLSWYALEAQFGIKAYHNESQQKMRGGSILRGVASRIACKVNYSEWAPAKACDEEFYGLSAHDMTLAALLTTFSDIHEVLGKVPKIGFGANIAFEIWRDDSYKMKVLYANDWKKTPRDITRFAPGCKDVTGFCDVNSFIEESRQLFFDDVHTECKKNVKNLHLHDVIRRSVEYTGAEPADSLDLIQLF